MTAAVVPAAATSVAAPSPAALAVAKKPCSSDIAAGWRCITLTLPADHFHNSGMTTKVTFALKRHTGSGPAKGTWVTITGGPGTAGIYSAVEYTIRSPRPFVATTTWSSWISAVRASPAASPVPMRHWTCTRISPIRTNLAATRVSSKPHERSSRTASTSPTSTTTCCRTTAPSRPSKISRHSGSGLASTRWLSMAKAYGTQYVQTYATAHPDHVQVLMLDGPVDLKVSGPRVLPRGRRGVSAHAAGDVERMHNRT